MCFFTLWIMRRTNLNMKQEKTKKDREANFALESTGVMYILSRTSTRVSRKFGPYFLNRAVVCWQGLA